MSDAAAAVAEPHTQLDDATDALLIVRTNVRQSRAGTVDIAEGVADDERRHTSGRRGLRLPGGSRGSFGSTAARTFNVPVRSVDLGGDLERQARALGNGDGAVWAFLLLGRH